jgi:trehalose 6-phosphate phosphatase
MARDRQQEIAASAHGDTSIRSAVRETSAHSLPLQLLAGDPHRFALYLDVDGTLLDIAITPDQVLVPEGLVELLVRLSKGLDGALAVITGRQLAEIDTLLAPAKFVGAGVHGAELRVEAGGPVARVASALPQSLVDDLMRRVHTLPGIMAEMKGPGLAVHYRLAPHLKSVVHTELRALLTPYGNSLVICPGRKLFEILPAGHSKGTALHTFAELPEFSGRKPIAIGDDMGDVPAIAMAQRLGGVGLRVGGEHFGRRDVEFPGPSSVIAWLQVLADRLDAPSRRS